MRKKGARGMAGEMVVEEPDPAKGLVRRSAADARRNPSLAAVVLEKHCPGIETQKPSDVRRNSRDERSLEEGGEHPNKRHGSEAAKKQRYLEANLHALG